MARKSNEQRLDVIRNAIQQNPGKRPGRIARLLEMDNKTLKFLDIIVADFVRQHDSGQRYEVLRPKIALFAATIAELKNELQPTVEAALTRNGISADRVSVKVGHGSTTKPEDIRAFNQLDVLDIRGTAAKNHHYHHHLFDGKLESHQEQLTS